MKICLLGTHFFVVTHTLPNFGAITDCSFFSWWKPSTARIEYWTQNALRTCLVLITVGIALKCPYSASMLGSVGGLTDAFQSFVLPPLIYINVSGLNLSVAQRRYNIAIILWGLGIILYTVTYNIATFVFYS